MQLRCFYTYTCLLIKAEVVAAVRIRRNQTLLVDHHRVDSLHLLVVLPSHDPMLNGRPAISILCRFQRAFDPTVGLVRSHVIHGVDLEGRLRLLLLPLAVFLGRDELRVDVHGFH